MSPNDFTAISPGFVVPTAAWEDYFDERGNPARREAKGFAFVPNELPPKLPQGEHLKKIVDMLETASSLLGELNGLAGDLDLAKLLSAPLLQREAIISSRIENTIATAEEVAAYDLSKQVANRDTVEVVNYRIALQHGLSSELPLCIRLVRQMHDLLLHDVRGENRRPGQIRDVQNWIGNNPSDFSSARFVPPPPGRHLDSCLTSLERFWNNPPAHFVKLICIAFAHYQIETIHPFADGNGRIGRALIALSLCRMKLLRQPLVYVSGYFEKHRDEYYDLLLRVSTHGEWDQWCRFFLTAVADQARDASTRLRRIRDLRQTVINQLAATNAPGRIFGLVDSLIQMPAINVTTIVDQLKVTHPTASKYIKRLEEIGFLREMTGGNYRQIWAAVPVFKIIESDDPKGTS